MRDVIQLPQLFELKPVLIRAFTAAKAYKKSTNEYGDDFIVKAEYRILLKYLRMYYEMWVAFDQIDTSDDRRVSINEFTKAVPKMQEWGLDMSDPEA